MIKAIAFAWFATFSLGWTATAPEKGVYRFTKDFELGQCAQFNNIGACLKKQITHFKDGDLINSDRSFFDDKKIEWDVGFMFFNQNVSLPTKVLEFVGPLTCPLYKDAYNSMLTHLERTCLKDDDCHGVELNFDPCEGKVASAKNAPADMLKFYEWELNRLQKFCQFKEKVCRKPQQLIFCDNGQCMQKVIQKSAADAVEANETLENKEILPTHPQDAPHDQ